MTDTRKHVLIALSPVFAAGWLLNIVLANVAVGYLAALWVVLRG